jgi:putative endonuclease
MDMIKGTGLRAQGEGIEKGIWYVYMVRCSDGTLYTGISNDLEKRIKAHNSGKDGARYTRSRKPVELVYSEQVESKSAAARLEYQIKRLPRNKKELIVRCEGERIGKIG